MTRFGKHAVASCFLSLLAVTNLSAQNLIAHWKLDESSGTVASDTAGSGLHGTYDNGVTLASAGPYPGEGQVAASLDGSDDKIDLPDVNFDFSNGLSVSVWVKPSSAPVSGQGYAFFDLSNGQDVDQIWLGWFNTVGFQLYLTDTDDGSTLRTIEDNTPFETDKWVHCVATVDAAGSATLYRNGQVTKTGFYTSLPKSILRSENSIGTSTWNDNFPGTMDDVRLYNYALSHAEVAELYGLVGHWKLSEGGGLTTTDDTGFANNANVNGATWISDCHGTPSLEFDGFSDTATTSSAFHPPDIGAVAFWMRGAGTLTSRGRVFGVNGNWEARQETNGTISFDLGASPFVGNEPFATTTAVDEDGKWYHVVAQYRVDDDTYEVYVDGQLEAHGISPVNLVSQSANTLSLGTRTGSSENWRGALRDMRVYQRWLGAGEIIELSGTAGHWQFDELSGTVVSDVTVNNNNGTINGGTLGIKSVYAPENGTAISFDGIDDYVEIPHAAAMLADEGTVAFWFRTPQLMTTQGLFSKDSTGFDTGGHLTLRLIGGKVNARLQSTTQSHTIEASTVTGIKWTHVAFSWGASGMSLYVNGRLEATDTEYTGGLGTTSGGSGNLEPLVIGANAWVSNDLAASPLINFLTGAMDDIRFYTRSLCAEEIYKIYRGGRASGVRITSWVEVR